MYDKQARVNPHFDHDRVVWHDDYSGLYGPVDYSQQFDYEWKLFLGKKIGFHQHTGVETADFYIDERIQELIGVRGYLERRRYGALIYRLLRFLRKKCGLDEVRMGVGGRLSLEPKFPPDHFRGKRCLDVGCGAGRWTKTLSALGASVKSVDMSEHGLQSTRRFNHDVERLDLFDIVEKRADLHHAFDFTICWGVIMCTHDPKLAFQNVAMTVKPGGELYTMIYAPTYHNSSAIIEQRRYYHTQLSSIEEKLEYAYSISDKPENAINYFDMLNTFYNWVVNEDTIYQWYNQQGFIDITTLNAHEQYKAAYHVLGRKRNIQ